MFHCCRYRAYLPSSSVNRQTQRVQTTTASQQQQVIDKQVCVSFTHHSFLSCIYCSLTVSACNTRGLNKGTDYDLLKAGISKSGWTPTSGSPTVIRVAASVALKNKWITQAKVNEIRKTVLEQMANLEFSESKDLNGNKWKDFQFTNFTDASLTSVDPLDFYLYAVVDGFHRSVCQHICQRTQTE